MTLFTIAVRNSWRDSTRALLTVLAIAVSTLVFLTLRTAATAWDTRVAQLASDRLATQNKLSFTLPLPMHYIDKVRAVPGVEAATGITWFAGSVTRRTTRRIASLAIDPGSFFAVYPEIVAPAEQLAAFRSQKNAAMIGVDLAGQLELRLGDRITLSSGAFPGTWDFVIAALYTSTRTTEGQDTFYLHSDYVNARADATRRDQVGWISIRVPNAAATSSVARSVDALFDTSGVPTSTMSVRNLNAVMAGMVSNVMAVVEMSSAAILCIMLLIVGNALAMSVRERSYEYGVLRVLGFYPSQILRLILFEGASLGTLGGLAGIAVAVPLTYFSVGPALQALVPGTFPYFAVAVSDILVAIGAAPLVSSVAALIPGWLASRRDSVQALRATL